MMEKFKFLVIAVFFMMTGIACSNSSSGKTGQDTQVEVKEKQGILIVQGACGMCKTRIEEAAKKVNGVKSASWDVETKKLSFNFDATKTSPENVSKAIAKAGHDTNLDQAPDSVYDTLHECCKYRTI